MTEDEAAALLALGYADGVAPASKKSGTTFHDVDRSYGGYNLISDGFEAEATLVGMDGDVLHKWTYQFADAFPDSESFAGEPGTYNWRRVNLLPDGSLLAVYNQHGLVKLDRDSRLQWTFEDHVHHDVEVLEDDSIWVLTNEAEIIPRINPDRPILHDFIVKLDAEGREVQRISVLEAIEASDFTAVLDRAPRFGDMMHTNEITVLDGQLASWNKAFAAGNLLISIRNMNTLAVVDPDTETVVWTLSDLFVTQHHATILENGHLMVFDNNGDKGRVSRVLEYDLKGQRIAWNYRGSERGMDSETLGAAHRLANGNTLITESNAGRAIEVTPDQKIVWEYYTTDRTGADDEFIAQLYEVLRLGDHQVEWLDGA